MNYKDINIAVLAARDIPKNLIKNNNFYSYLLDNNIAYYYCLCLSKDRSVEDKRIIMAGNTFNEKFIKTLKLLTKACMKNKINFLLFKTYKYIPEAVDGDIDLFVKERDFYRFMKMLKDEGFECFENEKLKGICWKEGFCKIEPRTNAEFHELIILNEKAIWKKTEKVNIFGIEVSKVSKEIDLLHLLLSVLYTPKYLSLYLFLIYQNCDIEKLYALVSNNKIRQDLKFLIKSLITDNVELKRFPLFMSNIDFVVWWCRRILFNRNLNVFARIKHILFFFYSKYSYIIFDKLVFGHPWSLEVIGS